MGTANVDWRTDLIPEKIKNYEYDAEFAHRRLIAIGQSGYFLIYLLHKEATMNWDRIEGNWKQFKGKVKQQWGKLTDDQIEVIAGRRNELAGKIQESYGISKDEAEKQLAAWQERQKEMEHISNH